MYAEEIIQGIRIVRPGNREGGYYFVENIATGACFTLKRIAQAEGDFTVMYKDSFGNVMVNNKNLKITFNKDEVMQFQGYRSHVYFSNDMSITALPMKDIQEIANKTFYNEEQKHVVDFVRLVMSDYNRAEFLLRY